MDNLEQANAVYNLHSRYISRMFEKINFYGHYKLNMLLVNPEIEEADFPTAELKEVVFYPDDYLIDKEDFIKKYNMEHRKSADKYVTEKDKGDVSSYSNTKYYFKKFIFQDLLQRKEKKLIISDLFKEEIIVDEGDLKSSYIYYILVFLAEPQSEYSLMREVVKRYFVDNETAVKSPRHTINITRVITDAGQSLVSGIRYDLMRNSSEYDKSPHYVMNSDLNELAALAYEKQKAKGQIALIGEKELREGTIEYMIELESPEAFPFDSHVLIRKLLQIVTANNNKEELCLIGSPRFIHGIISKATLNAISQDYSVYIASIKKERVWELGRYENGSCPPIVVSMHGNYMYSKQAVNFDAFDNASKKILNSSELELENQRRIIETAIKQEHGTTLVFTNNISEKERLNKSSISIKNIDLSSATSATSLVKSITRIDGAIMCDTSGICFAIGTILDGLTNESSNENIARGARHNSAHRYYASHKNECVIVVVSEDGDITVIPEENF